MAARDSRAAQSKLGSTASRPRPCPGQLGRRPAGGPGHENSRGPWQRVEMCCVGPVDPGSRRHDESLKQPTLTTETTTYKTRTRQIQHQPGRHCTVSTCYFFQLLSPKPKTAQTAQYIYIPRKAALRFSPGAAHAPYFAHSTSAPKKGNRGHSPRRDPWRGGTNERGEPLTRPANTRTPQRP